MMKKYVISVIILFIFVTFAIIYNIKTTSNKFYLESKYYSNSKIVDIDNNQLKKLEEKKESFVVFVYQPMCAASNETQNLIQKFSKEEKITIYKIPFSTIEGTDINACLKYYPSVSIYKKGKVISYLDADKKEDLKYYKSYNEFKKWIEKDVYLKTN